MILKQGHKYEPMPHDGKVIRRIYRGGRCYYIASPYSPEVTQALKAAFPQYWTAIRNYGVDHPQLVPFINEDPMLIVSLVEVGKTRWLVGDGKAYVDTGVTYNTANNYKAKFALQFTKINVGAYQLNGINAGAAFGEMNGILENGANSSTIPCDIDTVYNVTQYYNANSATCEIDGVGTLTRSTSSLPQYALTYGYVLFGCRSKEEVIYLCNEKMKFFNMEVNDVLIRDFIPMQRTDGTCGMLDIVSLTFHPNANTEGAFTIAITDKA